MENAWRMEISYPTCIDDARAEQSCTTLAAAFSSRSRVSAAMPACWPEGRPSVAVAAATEASATLKRTSRTSISCCCTCGDLA